MADQTHREVTLERLDEGVYLARNARGGELRFGSKASHDRTCTVSRTIEAGAPVTIVVEQ